MASKAALRIGALVGVAGITSGAWFAGKQVRSPAEAAATAKAPAASRITGAVEERALASSVIIRGLVRYGDPRAVVLAASAIKASATGTSGSGGATSIISAPAVKGEELAEGAVALSVGGRPVFVFAGKVPAYRDLKPGDSGDDVRQFEEALQRFNMSPGSADGVYDSSTEAAVERWYKSKGYGAFGPTDAQRSQLRTLRDNVSRAGDAVLSAQQNMTVAKRATSNDKLLAAREAVRVARDKVGTSADDAQREQERFSNELEARRSVLELAEKGVTVAEQALAKAQRDSTDTTPVADAQDAVATAGSQLRQAQAALDEAAAQTPLADSGVIDAKATLDAAIKDLDLTKRTKLTIPQADPNVVIIGDNSSLIRQAEGVVRQAEAALRTAQANQTAAARAIETRKTAIADAERAITRAKAGVERTQSKLSDRGVSVDEVAQRLATAVADREKAKRDLAVTEKTQTDAIKSAAVVARQAKGHVAVSEAQVRDAMRSSDSSAVEKQLRSAEQTKLRAQTELNDLERQIGVVVPANELLFFPALPLRVDDVRALRGDVVAGPVMTVTTARLAVDSSVDVSQAKLVRKGSPVTIESTEFNVTLQGTVTDVATTAGTKGVDPGKVYLEVTPVEGAKTDVDPKNLNGSSVKLTIPISSTGKAVLAVPVAAVSIAADGSSRVEVEDDPNKPTRFVTVLTGLAAEGFVEVTPVGGQLAVGIQVVVGNRDGTALEGVIETNDLSSDTTVPSDTTAAGGEPAASDAGASKPDRTPAETSAA
jgi:Putative peptidoglycan binding domain